MWHLISLPFFVAAFMALIYASPCRFLAMAKIGFQKVKLSIQFTFSQDKVGYKNKL
jgi:hypothetical protein